MIVAREEAVAQVRFFVEGIPQPGGSKRAFIRRKGGVVVGVGVTDAAKGNKAWRAVVAWFARQAYDGPPLLGPLRLVLAFSMPRPKGHFGTRGLRPSAPAHPTVKPDATKLLRALEDACTGILWRDDAQIVEQVVTKRYGERVGVEVRVEVVNG